MSTQPRDEGGRFTGEQAPETPPPAETSPQPAAPTPSGSQDTAWLEQFARANGITPDNAGDFARRAQQWAYLEDERTRDNAYRQLQSQFEPQPDPFQQTFEQAPQPGPQQAAYPQAQPPAPAPAPPQPPGAVTPEQLAQWWAQEQQNVVSSAEERAYERIRTQGLNTAVHEFGEQYGLNDHQREYIFTQAYGRQDVSPEVAIREAGQQYLEFARTLASEQAAPPAPAPGTGVPTNTPPAAPNTTGAPAAPYETPQTLEESAEITRQFG